MIDILGYVLLGVIGGLVAMQWFFARKAARAEGQPLPELSGSIAETLHAHNKSLLYFYSPHCGPCRAMTPIIERMARERSNVLKIDVSQDQQLARQFHVMATPTVIVVTPATIEKVVLGAMTEPRINALLN